MDEWDGRERRHMNQDDINRDRLLTEVHMTVLGIKDQLSRDRVVFEKHIEDDKAEFTRVRKWLLLLTAGLGVVVVLVGGVDLLLKLATLL